MSFCQIVGYYLMNWRGVVDIIDLVIYLGKVEVETYLCNT